MADGIRATPMANPILGLLADRLKKAQQFAASPYGYANPPAEMLLNLLGVPAAQQTMERMAYGEPLTTGSGMTTKPRAETVEAAMAVAPVAGLLGKTTKGLPVGMSIKDVGQQAPTKAIKRFNDGGLEVGYNRGDSKILVTMAPSGKDDRMLSASLENIGGYPSGTGDATMAYVDALESVIKDAKGKTVYWDGFTSESIQSDKAKAIYDRLKAAGIPFEKNVFDDRSKNALSLTQEQLLNIDFDEVRNNLLKSASGISKNSQDKNEDMLTILNRNGGLLD